MANDFDKHNTVITLWYNYEYFIFKKKYKFQKHIFWSYFKYDFRKQFAIDYVVAYSLPTVAILLMQKSHKILHQTNAQMLQS